MSGRDELRVPSGGASPVSSEARQLYRHVVRSHGRLALADVHPDSKEHLSELLHLGLLVPDSDNPDVLIAVDPMQLSMTLSSTWQRQALELLSRAVALPGGLQDLAEEFHAPKEVGGTIEYVRGKVLINQRLRQSVANGVEEILAAQPGGPRPPEVLASTIQQDLDTLRRGAEVRTIYHPSTRYHQPTRDYVATLAEAGGQFRTLDEPYTRLIIIDRRMAVLPVADDLNLAAFIRDEAIVNYLAQEVFERNWNRGLGFDGDRTVPQQVISRLRQTIIDLLLQGTNHRVIARRLGISERTLARHLAEMREEYNVESLFQLGYVLATRAAQAPVEPPADFQ